MCNNPKINSLNLNIYFSICFWLFPFYYGDHCEDRIDRQRSSVISIYQQILVLKVSAIPVKLFTSLRILNMSQICLKFWEFERTTGMFSARFKNSKLSWQIFTGNRIVLLNLCNHFPIVFIPSENRKDQRNQQISCLKLYFLTTFNF